MSSDWDPKRTPFRTPFWTPYWDPLDPWVLASSLGAPLAHPTEFHTLHLGPHIRTPSGDPQNGPFRGTPSNRNSYHARARRYYSIYRVSHILGTPYSDPSEHLTSLLDPRGTGRASEGLALYILRASPPSGPLLDLTPQTPDPRSSDPWNPQILRSSDPWNPEILRSSDPEILRSIDSPYGDVLRLGPQKDPISDPILDPILGPSGSLGPGILPWCPFGPSHGVPYPPSGTPYPDPIWRPPKWPISGYPI